MTDGLVFFGECFLGGANHADAGVEPAGDPLDVGHGAFVDDVPDQSLGLAAQLRGVVPDLQAGDHQNDDPDSQNKLVFNG